MGFTEPEPIACKWCGSKDIIKKGIRSDGVQEYLCQKCGRKFNAKDAPYKKQTPSEQIGASLSMYYGGLSFSDTWVVDEAVIKIGGNNLWFWDVIDEATGFLPASHLSRGRTILDVATVMRRAWRKADKAPKFIISDARPAYADGIERVFGAYSKNIQSRGFTEDININLIQANPSLNGSTISSSKSDFRVIALPLRR